MAILISCVYQPYNVTQPFSSIAYFTAAFVTKKYNQ